jgi:hypothetical protein
MIRALNVKTNPLGYTIAAALVFIAGSVIDTLARHHGAITTPVIVAAVTAAVSALTRQLVTPVADPKDGNGHPLHGPAAEPVPPLRKAAP